MCCHRAQIAHWNNFMMQKLFSTSSALRRTCDLTSAIGIVKLKEWCNDSKFHQLDFVAEGAKVVITQNMDLSVGAANGATRVFENVDVRSSSTDSINVRI
jgi:hypothetical protein